MTHDGTVWAAPAAKIAAGTRLNGIYEIDYPIGVGGMGEIYKGHAIQTGDAVAIKVIRPDLAENDSALALFRKEASILHNLLHEAIVRYYVFSVDPALGRPYLAMEFVDGPSLSAVLEKGPLSYDSVRMLQRRLAAGLQLAHELGIVHRDMSPDNVILPASDVTRAKIIDFGIARTAQIGGGTIIGGGFAGKHNYASPEQLGLFGGEVTAKSDIYSLGLVLAEALSGRALDMSGTQVQLVEKRRRVPDLDHIEPRMRPLIEWMLQPDPADRPESMTEVAEWRSGPPTALPRPATERSSTQFGRTLLEEPEPRRRWPVAAIAGIGALAVLGLAAAAIYGSGLWQGPEATTEATAPADALTPEEPTVGVAEETTEPGGETDPVPPVVEARDEPADIPGPPPSAEIPPIGGEIALLPDLGRPEAVEPDAPPGAAEPEPLAGAEDPPGEPAPPPSTESPPTEGEVVSQPEPGGPDGIEPSPPPGPAETELLAGVPDPQGEPPPPSTESPPGDDGVALVPSPGEPADLGSTAPPEIPPPPEPPSVVEPEPLTRVAEVTNYVRGYDGGECFVVTPLAVTEASGAIKANLEVFGSSEAAARALDANFHAANGFEAQILVRLVSEDQCPVVDFLERIGVPAEMNPEIYIAADQLRPGDSLKGFVAAGGGHLTLLLVSHQGTVENVSGEAQRAEGGASFDIALDASPSGPAEPQLLMALTTEEPLALPPAPAPAAEYFPQALAAAERSGQPVGVAVKYFKAGG